MPGHLESRLPCLRERGDGLDAEKVEHAAILRGRRDSNPQNPSYEPRRPIRWARPLLYNSGMANSKNGTKRAAQPPALVTTHEIRAVPLADLKPAPYNPRRINDAAMAALTKSLERFGYVEPIIWNKRSGFVVGGHQRLKVLRASKIKDVPVVIVDLAENEEKALNVALNSTHLSGEFTDNLQTLLAEIHAKDQVLFSELRLDQLLSDIKATAGRTDPDEVPEMSPQNDPKTKPGDLYTLGNHRLLCGDATKIECYVALMGGEKADIAFTSPPYNAETNELSNNHVMKKTRYASSDDKKSDTEYLEFLLASIRNMMQNSACVMVNIQALASNKVCVVEVLHDLKNNLIDFAIWNKLNGVPAMPRNVMSSQFEFILIFSQEQNPSRVIPCADFRGTVSNVYDGHPKKANEFYKIHAATFPIHLPTWIIESFTKKNACVLDPFGGTGTTMIAAEMLGRKARLIEIDPLYCDVIVQRWEDFTGGKAVLHGGKT